MRPAAPGTTAPPAAPPLPLPFPARYVQCYLVALDLFCYQAARQCIGLLIVSMGREFDFSSADKGTLLAALSFGSCFTSLLGSQVEAQLGARRTVSLGLLGMAFAFVVLPAAASLSLRLGQATLAFLTRAPL